MRLKNIDIEERMKHYRVKGICMAFIENGQISGTEIMDCWKWKVREL
ncbi:hypothetical protein [Gracilibacillus oryzae]|nr:hypothetical protein [Gracilibacillus oryzae]